MATIQAARARTKPATPTKTAWLGPHFYLELIRLTRKGWPTLARVGYLTAMLASLAFMYHTQRDRQHLLTPAQYALLAQEYASTLIVIQDLLILALLPVYVASAIAQEKENQTLEALTLTHLSDRELVLGKLCGRLVHVGAIAISSLPILALMTLWGNVDLQFIIYHEANTFLLLVSAGSLCIFVSTCSQSVFQAVSRSYPWLLFMAIFGVGGAFALPWIVGAFVNGSANPTPTYLIALWPLALVHAAFAFLFLWLAIDQMERLRKEERRQPKKTTGAMTLADAPKGPEPRVGKRGQTRSRIHPWAWPVRGDALWWKECIKDGTSWSMSVRWLVIAIAVVAAISLPCGVIYRTSAGTPREGMLAVVASFAFTAYFVALAAYALVVLFQTTLSVAGEREHDTLTTLLLLPEERRNILLAKWIGPWWRNWPIMAISCLGAGFGCGVGIYGPIGLVILLLMPWPFLAMLSGLSLWLSVICRRVLYANIAVVGFLGFLLLAHIVAGAQSRVVLSFYVAGIGGTRIDEVVRDLTWTEAAGFAFAEQAVFLLIGVVGVFLAFRIFVRRDYAGT